jgi:DNA-binding IclR family transcriptional regulator
MPKQPPTMTRSISSLERAIAVLGALADSPSDLGTNEIARRTGLNPSSVSRLLATLARDEFVRRVADTGRYRLGPRLIELGNAALARIDLRELARPHLIALTDATGETATLSVPSDQTAITVDFVPSRATVRSVTQLGRQSVLHATATGKVVLAHGDSGMAGPLTAYTRHTITDPDELARDVAQVRERGWAEAIREREDDLNAVAVPVLDGDGTLVAILGIQGPAGRFDRRAMRAAVDRLREHAARLSPGAVSTLPR